MDVIHYTDPACPFAFSAEPHRLRLAWHYGEQLHWRTVLVVLASSIEQLETKGMTTSMLAKNYAKLQREHGMPIDPAERPRLAASRPACLAIAATRLHDPEGADALLRALRVHTMAGMLLDAPETLDAAAVDAGLDAATVRAWMEAPAAEADLDADMRAARRPMPAATVLDHKLADAEDGGRRYTCPSYELQLGDESAVAPGFQPWAAYDVLVANLDPSLERRDPPEDVHEVLAWAPHPLATAEVAALLDVDPNEARTKLADAGAAFDPVGPDGYWRAAAA